MTKLERDLWRWMIDVGRQSVARWDAQDPLVHKGAELYLELVEQQQMEDREQTIEHSKSDAALMQHITGRCAVCCGLLDGGRPIEEVKMAKLMADRRSGRVEI